MEMGLEMRVTTAQQLPILTKLILIMMEKVMHATLWH